MTPPTDEARATDFEEEAVWAHVIRDGETHEPTVLDDEAAAVVNKALSIYGSTHFIERSWIRPGPLLEEGGR